MIELERFDLIQQAAKSAALCVAHVGERTNESRVNEAAALFDLFHAMTGVNYVADGEDTALSDMLAHLMHFADANGLDFTECVYRAARHHGDEVADESDA